MKPILSLLAVVLFASCSRAISQPHPSVAAGNPDTVIVTQIVRDTVRETIILHDTVTVVLPAPSHAALVRKNDSLHAALLVSNYKLERVRFYLRLANRSTSQQKFLRGWLNRVFAL